MNIKEAKDYIKNTVLVYLKKDEFGEYRIPVSKQRPIFLLGSPGIGKTAIMEQIASELDIALVSYSMTHHTRQSALGLPFIEKKDFGGKEYSVSEYTMSEIIASIYETMEESGTKEGILFLDEINCVSETLYPSMLQFLQYKVFGRHSVPNGWVIVTAGNPPEFNRSVREFDVVTLDRLKVLEVEADYDAWRKYAVDKGLHPAILSFLDLKKEYFYKVETTVSGKAYVTARGWEDLSDVITLYEEEGLKVTDSLVEQYLRNKEVVHEFSAYYDLYNKYKRNYKIGELLSGSVSKELKEKLLKAAIDERLTFVGMLLDKVKNETKDVCENLDCLMIIKEEVKKISESKDIKKAVKEAKKSHDDFILKKKKAGTLNQKELRVQNKIKALLSSFEEDKDVSASYNESVKALKENTLKVKEHIDNFFKAVNEIFGEDSNEMLVAVTEITLSESSSRFLASFGSSEYDTYQKRLMVNDRKQNLRKEILEFI